MTDTVLLDEYEARGYTPYVVQVLKWPGGWVDKELFGDVDAAAEEVHDLARLYPLESYRLVHRTGDSDDR